MIFKVGDKAVCYKPSEDYNTGEHNPRGGAGWVPGESFVIGRISPVERDWGGEGDLYILWPDDDRGGVFHCYAKLINILPDELFMI